MTSTTKKTLLYVEKLKDLREYWDAVDFYSKSLGSFKRGLSAAGYPEQADLARIQRLELQDLCINEASLVSYIRASKAVIMRSENGSIDPLRIMGKRGEIIPYPEGAIPTAGYYSQLLAHGGDPNRVLWTRLEVMPTPAQGSSTSATSSEELINFGSDSNSRSDSNSGFGGIWYTLNRVWTF